MFTEKKIIKKNNNLQSLISNKSMGKASRNAQLLIHYSNCLYLLFQITEPRTINQLV